MIKLALNVKHNNHAFFCPVSRLHLTVGNPVDVVNEVTPAIIRGLKSKVLVDVDGVIDLETGAVKKGSKTPEKEQPKQQVAEPEKKAEEPAKEVAPETPEAKETTNKKRGKRAEAPVMDEAADK